MASIITATVKYPAGRVNDTVNGPKINAVLVLPDGSEYKKWGKPDDPRLKSLKRGQKIQMLADGDTYKFLDDDTPGPGVGPAPAASLRGDPPALAGSKWDEAHRSQIFNEMKRRAAVLAECHNQIYGHFSDGEGNLLVSEETVRRYAAVLYADLKDLWQ